MWMSLLLVGKQVFLPTCLLQLIQTHHVKLRLNKRRIYKMALVCFTWYA
ncbi:hypothetical protein GYH30_015314 [Glycine max]|nr:hypothetical protein GYH30_015314 [Glycine max]